MAATNLLHTSKRLMMALNAAGYKLTFSTKQFIGRDNITHTMYCINKAWWNEEKERYYHTELYSSTSLVRIVLYLRDMWFEYNHWELPTDQAEWNRIREEIADGRHRTRTI